MRWVGALIVLCACAPRISRVAIDTPAPLAVASTPMPRCVSTSVTTRHIDVARGTYDPVAIDLPVVSGLESILTPEKLLGESLDEVRSDAAKELAAGMTFGLQSAGYQVLYNTNGILEIDETTEWMGAYPSGNRFHVLVDVVSRRAIDGTAFRASSRRSLVEHLDALVVREIAASEVVHDPDFAQLAADAHARDGDLDDFSVSETGVTFHHDYAFPHVALALAPPGNFSFTWASLADDVDPAGPLARFTSRQLCAP